VGAAFFGHDGSCAGAVSVTGIKGDLPAWRIDELGRIVRRYADGVSVILGGSPYVDLGLAERAEAEWAEAGRAQAGRAQAGRAEAGRAEAGRAQAGRAQAGRAEAT
jgi:hypothetical protein